MADQKGRGNEGQQGHNVQGKQRSKVITERKSPKPSQRKAGHEQKETKIRYSTPGSQIKTSQNPASIPSASLGILSSILRSPHPGMIRPQTISKASAENPAQKHGVGPVTVQVQRQPFQSSVKTGSGAGSSPRREGAMLSTSITQPGRASPSRTPITLPPKKSLSPSRMLYTEQIVSAPVPQQAVSSPISQSGAQHQQYYIAHGDIHLLPEPQTVDTKPDKLFQQYKQKTTSTSTSGHLPQTERLRRALAEHAHANALKSQVQPDRQRRSPSPSHPQPAHQHPSTQSATPPLQVSTIRRTPSPAHMPGQFQQKRQNEVIMDQGKVTQAVNLSVASTHDRPKEWQSHVTITQPKQTIKSETGNVWDTQSFQYGDLLQSINRSHDSAQAHFQSTLSPITPADSEPNPHFNLDASSQPAHTVTQIHHYFDAGKTAEGIMGRGSLGADGTHIPIPSSIPVPISFSSSQTVGFMPVQIHTSQSLGGHSLHKSSTGHAEKRTVSPKQTVNISTSKYTSSSSSSRTTSPKPTVNMSTSLHMPADISNMKQPVVSLVRLPHLGVDSKDFLGKKGRFTPPPNVSLIQQAPPPNVTVTSSGTIPYQTLTQSNQRSTQSQRHSRNPFTFPATPPISIANEVPRLLTNENHRAPEQLKSQIHRSQDSSFDIFKQRHQSGDMPCLVPVSPFKTEVKKEVDENFTYSELVKMPNPFNQRLQTLANFPNNATYRPTYRATSVALHRAKSGCITSSAKSLDILRQNLQRDINKEINVVIQKYLDKFFKKGVENIKLNNGDNAVSDDHMQAVCRQILEEAKKMYISDSGRRSVTPTRDTSDNVSESGSTGRRSALGRRRHPSDTDSDASLRVPAVKRKKGRPLLTGRSTPSKLNKDQWRREGPKYDPERLKTSTEFVMGSRANKAMGFGATRGRLYMKHPDLFKYSGDQDDKQWLYENHFMPATGGKAYMLVLEDITELGVSDEYKNSPGMTLDELKGFCVPQWMIEKIKTQMLSMRTDIPKQKHRSRSTTPSEVSSILQEDKDLVGSKELPFSSFSSPKLESNTDVLVHRISPPADDDMEFLTSAANQHVNSELSPFNMTGGFGDPTSDLDGLDDETSLEPTFGLEK